MFTEDFQIRDFHSVTGRVLKSHPAMVHVSIYMLLMFLSTYREMKTANVSFKDNVQLVFGGNISWVYIHM